MKLSETETFQRCLTLGLSSALMIANGYPGEVSSEPLTLGLLVPVHGALRVHRLHPFRGPQGLPGCSAGGCQGPRPMGMVGYTFSDIISKCGVGYLVYRIGLAKSMTELAEK